MNIDTILESAHITHDDKARRVLNTAPDTFADITLSEIERGITIERLTALNVPVYQYSTQITIHGLFQDIPSDLRVAGYKAVILNGNNSLGVKYVAIDGAKKQLLRDVSQYGNKTWGISIDSQGCECWRIFASADSTIDKQKTIECYNSTPDSLYIGGKQAAALMYGGYAVIIKIGAIYNDNVWPLISALTGINNDNEYQARIIQEAEIDKARTAQYEIDSKARQETERITLETTVANFTPPDNWIPFNGKPSAGNIYARIKLDYSGHPMLKVSQYAKRGTFVCIASKEFADMQYKAWQPSHYSKASLITITGWIITDKPQARTPASIATDNSAITIRRNEKLNGLELIFTVKPAPDTINTLKALGFRWSHNGGLWYNRYTEPLLNQVNSLLAINVTA